MRRFLGKNMRMLYVVSVFVSVNIVAYSWLRGIRLDSTDEGRFSISQPSLDLLQKIPERVNIKLYASDVIASELPVMKNYTERVKDFMSELARKSGGRLTFEYIRVQSFSDAEDMIVATGLTALPLPDGRSVFFGMTADNMLDGQGVLPFLSPEREEFLEYDIASLIEGLSRLRKNRVALTSSLPLAVGPGGMQSALNGKARPVVLYSQLQSRYDVTLLSEDYKELTEKNAPPVTVIVHPHKLTKKAKNNLKSYLSTGGRVIAAVDPLSEFPAPPIGDALKPHPVSSDLGGLLKEFGITYSTNEVVLDQDAALKLRDPRSGREQTYLAHLVLSGNYFNKLYPPIASVKRIDMSTAGHFKPDPNYKGNLKFTPLIYKNGNADFIATDKLAKIPTPEALQERYIPRTGYITSGVIMGKFSKNATASGALLLVGDSDFINDRMWLRYTEQSNGKPVPFTDNANMLMNFIDHMNGDTALIALRGRKTYQRPLTYLEDIRQAASEKFAAREKELDAKIITLRQRIKDARQKHNGVSGAPIPLEINTELSNFATELAQTRDELRNVKRNMNNQIREAEMTVKIINILLIPPLIGALPAIFLLLRRFRRPIKPQAVQNLGKA